MANQDKQEDRDESKACNKAYREHERPVFVMRMVDGKLTRIEQSRTCKQDRIKA